MFDVEGRDDRPPSKNYDGETMWRRTKGTRNTMADEDESDSRLSRGTGYRQYEEERVSRESHDRSKRSRRSSSVAGSDNRTSVFASGIERGGTKDTPERIAGELRPPVVGTTRESTDRAAATDSTDFERKTPAVTSNVTDSTWRLVVTNRGAADSGESAGNRDARERDLGAAALNAPRHGADGDGRSEGAGRAGERIPRGNTSRSLGTATNESRDDDEDVVGTTAATAAAGAVIAGSETREGNREPIPGVIKVFEPRGRPYQKQRVAETAAAARLSRRTGESGTSRSAEKKMSSTSDVDESRNANAREDPSSASFDFVDKKTTTTKRSDSSIASAPGIGESTTPADRRDDSASTIAVRGASPREQQMAPSLIAGRAGGANKSNGNSDTDGIDIRGSHGNETMNVKGGGIGAVTEADGLRESDNNTGRKLLWITAISADAGAEDTSARMVAARRSESVADENRPRSETITRAGSGNRVKREDNAYRNPTAMRADLNEARASDANRYERSAYFLENLESNNEVDPESVAIEKEAPTSPDEKREDNEEYLNPNAEDAENYDDGGWAGTIR